MNKGLRPYTTPPLFRGLLRLNHRPDEQGIALQTRRLSYGRRVCVMWGGSQDEATIKLPGVLARFPRPFLWPDVFRALYGAYRPILLGNPAGSSRRESGVLRAK